MRSKFGGSLARLVTPARRTAFPHSAMANEYCPSSSTVARRFGTNFERQNPPFLRLKRRRACAAARFFDPARAMRVGDLPGIALAYTPS
jgi:hypothetical protein